MNQITYLNEKLFFGHLGNGLIVLAFVAALTAVIGYLKSALNNNEHSWKIFARRFFILHTLSVFGIFFLLLYLIVNHRYEYMYVWEHSNNIMPMRYILSCIWEGQEGSFLLWMLWHSVIGCILIFKSKEWESGVMSVISMVQVFLVSMILGVVIFGSLKIGSNPFLLLRENPEYKNLPFVKLPNYLDHLDGRGLNPLLQNYWMTIHPPTLFLGFALTVVPFAFALAGLMRRKYSEWVKPALPWTFAGIMILGTGILMGAAWAYESLSFGGFWAWDPVENASLVPWMILVGAGHVMLIHKSRGTSLLASIVLCTLSFLLILYSTFLTRSGILGNTSVHAFTDLGMNGQLIVYMAFFFLLTASLIIYHFKKINPLSEDEKISSREFWMFIGTLILIIGSIQITFETSKPVWNKIFGTNMSPGENIIESYNKWQIPVSILLCIVIAFGQFLRYKESDSKAVLKKLLPSIIIAAVLTICSVFILGDYRIHYYALLFATIFAAVANIGYLLQVLKGKMKISGPSVAHTGFALILLGALISNSKQEIISRNVKGVNLGKDFPYRENIMIEQGIDTLPMGKYFVTYKGREQKGINIYFTIEYFERDKTTGRLSKSFELKPFLQLNERMGNVAEPSTQKFFDKDIYTHLTYAEMEDSKSAEGDLYLKAKEKDLAIGDTMFSSNSFIILERLNKISNTDSLQLNKEDVVIGAQLRIEDINRTEYRTQPLFIIRGTDTYSTEVVVDSLGLKISFSNIDPATGKVKIALRELKTNKKDFIIMKAIIFPWINILWMGCLLMIVGCIIAIVHRTKTN